MRIGYTQLPLKRLSATSIGLHMNCPEQFRQKYLLNVKETMSGDRFVGSVTHQALEKLFKGEEPEQALHETWQEIIEKEGEPEWYDTDSIKAFKTTKLMLETYWPIAQSIEPIAVEQRFEETIDGVHIVGYIDRELTDRILEVKTSSKRDKKPKSRWAFQGRLYSLVSAKPVEYHIVTRQVTPQVVTAAESAELLVDSYQPDATVALLRLAVQQIADNWNRYGKENPWPMQGVLGDWTCNYCSFKKQCLAWKRPESSPVPVAVGSSHSLPMPS